MEGRSFFFIIIIYYYLFSSFPLLHQPGMGLAAERRRQQRKGVGLQVVGQGDIFVGLESKLGRGTKRKKRQRREKENLNSMHYRKNK